MNGARRDATFVTMAGVMDVGVVRNGSRGKVEMRLRASKVRLEFACSELRQDGCTDSQPRPISIKLIACTVNIIISSLNRDFASTSLLPLFVLRILSVSQTLTE